MPRNIMRNKGVRRERRFIPRPKVCSFCTEKTEIDYKDIPRLRSYISDRGRIEPRRRTGSCAKHQRRLALAIKRARYIALLPYTQAHIRQMGGLGRQGKPLREKQSAETDVST